MATEPKCEQCFHPVHSWTGCRKDLGGYKCACQFGARPAQAVDVALEHSSLPADPINPSQPAPVITARSRDVEPSYQRHQCQREARLLAWGLKKYGKPLQTWNGRNALEDAAEEHTSLGRYLEQAAMERADLERQLAQCRELLRRVANGEDIDIGLLRAAARGEIVELGGSDERA